MGKDGLALAGAGGFGREVFEYLGDTGQIEDFEGFLDDAVTGAVVPPYSVLGTIKAHDPAIARRVAICIGDCQARRKAARSLTSGGAVLASIIHPSAYIAPSARVGDGVIVAPFAFIGPNAQVGNNCVLNTYASVGHDAEVGHHSVLCPYAVLNGHSTLGEAVFLGTHSTVMVGVSIGKFSKVSAGTIATKDTPPGHLVAGNPARYREMFRISE